MGLGELLPWLTGGGGAIVAMAFGYWAILNGKLVTGREHDRVLKDYDKVAAVNDSLTASLAACRDSNAQLLSSGQLTTRLLDALTAVAQQRALPAAGRPDDGGG